MNDKIDGFAKQTKTKTIEYHNTNSNHDKNAHKSLNNIYGKAENKNKNWGGCDKKERKRKGRRTKKRANESRAHK